MSKRMIITDLLLILVIIGAIIYLDRMDKRAVEETRLFIDESIVDSRGYPKASLTTNVVVEIRFEEMLLKELKKLELRKLEIESLKREVELRIFEVTKVIEGLVE